MSKATKKSQAVIDAEQCLAAIDSDRAVLHRHLQVSDEQYGDAYRALVAARIEADKDLPKCTVITSSRWHADQREEMVIHRRTDKSIKARRVGGEYTREFRSKDGKTWSEYPSTKGYSSSWSRIEFTHTKE